MSEEDNLPKDLKCNFCGGEVVWENEHCGECGTTLNRMKPVCDNLENKSETYDWEHAKAWYKQESEILEELKEMGQ